MEHDQLKSKLEKLGDTVTATEVENLRVLVDEKQKVASSLKAQKENIDDIISEKIVQLDQRKMGKGFNLKHFVLTFFVKRPPTFFCIPFFHGF